ncbi:hypothetical protein M569_15581, partial [Genlisea aurea]
NNIKALSGKTQMKRERKKGRTEDSSVHKGEIGDEQSVEVENGNDRSNTYVSIEGTNVVAVPSRGDVLQSCSVTSGFIGFLGVVIRMV